MTGGIIFCGGQSSRMGTPKELLTVAGEPLLLRTIRTLRPTVESIMISARPGQPLPALPEDIRVIHDSTPNGGPLAALNDALAAMAPACDAVLAVACDLPNLTTPFLERLMAVHGDDDAVIPHDGERWHPLAAVYSCHVQPVIARLVADGRRSMHDLIAAIRVRRFTADDWPNGVLTDVLRNVNTPGEFADVLRDSATRDRVTPP